MIRTEKLSAGYTEKCVLNDVSLEIAQGAFTAILGPNGAGKSTLLKCLCGFIVPKSGNVFLKSKNIANIKKEELAKSIAIVPQRNNLQFEYKVRDLVLMGRFPYLNYLGAYSRKDYATVDELLEKLGLVKFSTKNFSELSGGEQQRVIIARALAQETPLLLLDEAFTGLDINHSLSIMSLLKQINRDMGKTIVLVSHNINLAIEFCNEAIILKKGKIFNTGSSREIISEKNLSEVYEHRLRVITNPESGLPNLIYTP